MYTLCDAVHQALLPIWSSHHITYITAQAQGEKQQNTTRGRSAALLQPLQLPFGPFHMRFVHGVGDAANRAADVAEGTMRIHWEANDDTVRRDRRRRAPQACSTKKGSVEQQNTVTKDTNWSLPFAAHVSRRFFDVYGSMPTHCSFARVFRGSISGHFFEHWRGLWHVQERNRYCWHGC